MVLTRRHGGLVHVATQALEATLGREGRDHQLGQIALLTVGVLTTDGAIVWDHNMVESFANPGLQSNNAPWSQLVPRRNCDSFGHAKDLTRQVGICRRPLCVG